MNHGAAQGGSGGDCCALPGHRWQGLLRAPPGTFSGNSSHSVGRARSLIGRRPLRPANQSPENAVYKQSVAASHHSTSSAWPRTGHGAVAALSVCEQLPQLTPVAMVIVGPLAASLCTLLVLSCLLSPSSSYILSVSVTRLCLRTVRLWRRPTVCSWPRHFMATCLT